MKKITYLTASLIIMIGLLVNCTNMDDTYKDYVIPGGRIYPERAKALVLSGHNRLKVAWPKGSDPSITKARIFWNNYTDSVELDVKNFKDTIFYEFKDMPEGSYSYIVRTYDADMNVSIPSEINGRSYGDNYMSFLYNRPINEVRLTSQDSKFQLEIFWGNADISNGMVGTVVTYRNKANKDISVFLPADDKRLVIEDIDENYSHYSYYSYFRPDPLCIDSFRVETDKGELPPPLNKIATTGWVATASSEEPTAQIALGGGPVGYLIDGDVKTFWHSQHQAKKMLYPHWISFDMGTNINVAAIELTNRQSTNFAADTFKDFELLGSLDGVEWTSYGNFINTNKLEPQLFHPGEKLVARYIKLNMTSHQKWGNVNTYFYAHLAEFGVYGRVEK